MSSRRSAWNLTDARPAAGKAGGAKPSPLSQPGWQRTAIASVALFLAFFALLAWRMQDGIDPALVANAKIAKVKVKEKASDANMQLGQSYSYGERGYSQGYGNSGGDRDYDNYGSSSQYQGGQPGVPQPSTRAS